MTSHEFREAAATLKTAVDELVPHLLADAGRFNAAAVHRLTDSIRDNNEKIRRAFGFKG